jgi:hypothetical protein
MNYETENDNIYLILQDYGQNYINYYNDITKFNNNNNQYMTNINFYNIYLSKIDIEFKTMYNLFETYLIDILEGTNKNEYYKKSNNYINNIKKTETQYTINKNKNDIYNFYKKITIDFLEYCINNNTTIISEFITKRDDINDYLLIETNNDIKVFVTNNLVDINNYYNDLINNNNNIIDSEFYDILVNYFENNENQTLLVYIFINILNLYVMNKLYIKHMTLFLNVVLEIYTTININDIINLINSDSIIYTNHFNNYYNGRQTYINNKHKIKKSITNEQYYIIVTYAINKIYNIQNSRSIETLIVSDLLNIYIPNDFFINTYKKNIYDEIQKKIYPLYEIQNTTIINKNTTDEFYKSIMFDCLNELLKDIFKNNNNIELVNGDNIRLIMYNYYILHILQNYTTTFNKTLTAQNYEFPNANYLNTTIGTKKYYFDPNYVSIMDNFILYHILDMNNYNNLQNSNNLMSSQLYFNNIINISYENYIYKSILKTENYTKTDGYISYLNYISTLTNIITINNVSGIVNNILTNIHINNLLHFKYIINILKFLYNSNINNNNHYRIGFYNLYEIVNNKYVTINAKYNTIHNNTNINLYDNIDNIILQLSNLKIPNVVIDTFKNDLTINMNKLFSSCQNVIQDDIYNEYINSFDLYTNLLINETNISYLQQRLDNSINTTLNDTNINYNSIFSNVTELEKLGVLNYIPYLAVRDIPILLYNVFNQLKSSTFNFINDAIDTNENKIYALFMNYFNMIDTDELIYNDTTKMWSLTNTNTNNNNNNISPITNHIILKKMMYQKTAEAIIIDNINNNIYDINYFKQIVKSYGTTTSKMTCNLLRNEGLFPEKTIYIKNKYGNDELIECGDNKYSSIEWICNSYLELFTNMAETFFDEKDETNVEYKYFLTSYVKSSINTYNTIKTFVNNSIVMGFYGTVIESIYNFNDIDETVNTSFLELYDSIEKLYIIYANTTITNISNKVIITNINSLCILTAKYITLQINKIIEYTNLNNQALVTTAQLYNIMATTLNTINEHTNLINTYTTNIKNIITYTITCFNTKSTSLVSLDVYNANGNTLFGIDNNYSLFKDDPLTITDGLNSVWLNMNKLYIQQYNYLINNIFLSETYYDSSLGIMCKKIFTKMQTEYANKITPLFTIELNEIMKNMIKYCIEQNIDYTIDNTIIANINITNTLLNDNFDTTGIKFLLSIGYLSIINNINYFEYNFSDIIDIVYAYINKQLSDQTYNFTIKTQYDILVWMFLSRLYNIFYNNYGNIIGTNIMTVSQYINLMYQFYQEQRYEITQLEIEITNINMNLINFGIGFLTNYGTNIINNKITLTNALLMYANITYLPNNNNISYQTLMGKYLNEIVNMYNDEIIKSNGEIETIKNFYINNYSKINNLSVVTMDNTNYYDLNNLLYNASSNDYFNDKEINKTQNNSLNLNLKNFIVTYLKTYGYNLYATLYSGLDTAINDYTTLVSETLLEYVNITYIYEQELITKGEYIIQYYIEYILKLFFSKNEVVLTSDNISNQVDIFMSNNVMDIIKINITIGNYRYIIKNFLYTNTIINTDGSTNNVNDANNIVTDIIENIYIYNSKTTNTLIVPVKVFEYTIFYTQIFKGDSIYVGFNNDNIQLLTSKYTYYNETYLHQETLENLETTPVLTKGYNFYVIPNTNIYTNGIEYVDDLSQYYLTIYNNYNNLKNILTIREDYNNIITDTNNNTYVTKNKKDYFYNYANQTINDYQYNTISKYINLGNVGSTQKLIINDTATNMLSSYIAPMDVIKTYEYETQYKNYNFNINNEYTTTETIKPIISQSNLFNIVNLFLSLNNSSINPFIELSQNNYSYLFNWYINTKKELTYFNDLIKNKTIYDNLINVALSFCEITPSILYSNNNIHNYYNNYENYSDIILYIQDNILKKTKMELYKMIEYIDLDNTLYLMKINDILKKNVENELNNTLKITEYKTGTINDYGLIYPFYNENNFLRYKRTIFGFEIIKTNLEKELLNLITKQKPNYAWVKELGHKIIKCVKLNINGQDIEVIDCDLQHFLHNFYDNMEHNRGYNKMIGNVDDMYKISNDTNRSVNKLHIPLKMFFCRSTGQCLPLINLLHSTSLLKIELSELGEILYTDKLAKYKKIPEFKISLLSEYIYIEEEERYKLINSRLQYLFDRYKLLSKTIVTYDDIFNDILQNNNVVNTTLNANKTITITLNGLTEPVKFLIWTVKFFNKKTQQPKDIIDWNTNGYNIRDEMGKINNIKKIFEQIRVVFNGRDREHYKDEGYYTTVVPYEKHIPSLNEGEYIYSFALFPLLLQPSGTANFEHIEECSLQMDLTNEIIEKYITQKELTLEIKTWSCSYNLFMVMSGIGAIMFNNV